MFPEAVEPLSVGGKSGSKRSVCRNRAADRFSAPRGETLLLLPPRPSQTYTRARGHEGPRGIGSGCEVHSARGDDTTQLYCIKQEYRRSARLLPLESLARGCSGSKFFCAPGPAVQGRSSRASSPARPSLDLDHALLFALYRPSRWRNALKHYWKPRLTKTTAKRLRPKNKS